MIRSLQPTVQSSDPRLVVPPINQRIGLGDVVKKGLKPIVMLVDAMGGNLGGCGGCRQRQAALNKVMPDIRHPLTR